MKVIIIGNTNYSVLLKEYIEETGVNVDAFCVDRKYISTPKISEKPVISIESLFQEASPDSILLFLGIGYSRLGKTKQEIYLKFKEKGFRFCNYIHPSAQINHSAVIGEGNCFFENVVVQGHSVIGNGNLFFSNATIMHDNQIGDYNTFGAGSVLNGFVRLGNCNFIGANATVKDYIRIGENNLIGAGAFVNKPLIEGSAVLPVRSLVLEEKSCSLAEKLMQH